MRRENSTEAQSLFLVVGSMHCGSSLFNSLWTLRMCAAYSHISMRILLLLYICHNFALIYFIHLTIYRVYITENIFFFIFKCKRISWLDFFLCAMQLNKWNICFAPLIELVMRMCKMRIKIRVAFYKATCCKLDRNRKWFSSIWGIAACIVFRCGAVVVVILISMIKLQKIFIPCVCAAESVLVIFIFYGVQLHSHMFHYVGTYMR